MIPFVAPVEDILFSLRHVAGCDDDMAAAILPGFAAFAEGVLAPLNSVGDAQGARMADGRVVSPDGFRQAYRQLARDGWQGLTLPERFGGMAQGPMVAAAVSEVFSGANHALQMLCNLAPGAAQILLAAGSPAQQERWLPRLALGSSLATMCLTEPGAGSDLSRIACRAAREGEVWRLDGEKIFISGGDQDLSDDILHLVLARTGEDGLGGLSLFLCPSGPDVRCLRLEAKMGLHASPTCHMRFDGARAELLGGVGEGLALMFMLMNHARLDVALQGVAHAARAGHVARTYAGERSQGRRPDGGPARLADHPDIARMLDLQDALALGARGMCHVALKLIETGAPRDLVDFLTSTCKIFGSEAGAQAADLGIQILGGYGYLTEYGLSQTWRDARVTQIYEGANGIHARALAIRGVRGAAPALFCDLIRDLAGPAGPVEGALAQWRARCDALRASADAEAEAHGFAQLTARIFHAAVWARIAAEARHHPDPDRLSRVGDRVRKALDASDTVY